MCISLLLLLRRRSWNMLLTVSVCVALCSNKEDGVVSLMIEYMDGGSLQDIVDMGGCDDEPTLANIAVQALKGLLFLHENYQIHRDLKPGTSYS
jgi:serine/threonine protein kinase